MNLRERLQIRTIINLIISVIERLVSIFNMVEKKFSPKIDEPSKTSRPRPLKKVVDTISNIVPLPWRTNKK